MFAGLFRLPSLLLQSFEASVTPSSLIRISMTHRAFAFSLIAVAALAACSPDFVSPRVLPSSPSLAVNASGSSGSYLVALNGKGPRNFAELVTSLGGTVTLSHPGAGIALVSGLTDAAAATLAASSGIADVQRDVEVRVDSPVRSALPDAVDVGSLSAGDASGASVANPAGAFYYVFQWNLKAVGADEAWKAGKLGSSSVTVAILDSGIDYDGYDMAGQVDLARSKSFVASDDAIAAAYFPTRNAISDFNGHGTNVATQVSSRAAAFAGVTSRTRLMGVKVIGWSGAGTMGSVLNGLLYAADAGANIANMSLGGAFDKPGLGRLTSIVNRVFNYANRKGMLIVVAAGNARPPDFIPVDLAHSGNEFNTYCDAPHVICVAATGPITNGGDVNVPAWYSYYGNDVITVAAPGGNQDIVNPDGALPFPWGDKTSWIFSLCSKTLIVELTAETGVPIQHESCQTGLQPIGGIGTSQAAPHVAGLAALLMAEYGTGHPSQIKDRIEATVTPLSPVYNGAYGLGEINVRTALGL